MLREDLEKLDIGIRDLRRRCTKGEDQHLLLNILQQHAIILEGEDIDPQDLKVYDQRWRDLQAKIKKWDIQ